MGAIPAVFAFGVRRAMREPELFERARRRERGELPVRLLVRGDALRFSLGMLVLTSVQNFGYYGLIVWLPTYLSDRFEFGVVQTGAWTALTVVGMAVGIAAFGVLADRYGRRPLFLLFQAGAAACPFWSTAS